MEHRYKGIRTLILLALSLTLLILAVSPVYAYSTNGVRWPGTSTYWSFDNYAPVPSTWQTSIINANATWNNAGSRFRFVHDEVNGDALRYTHKYYSWGNTGEAGLTSVGYNTTTKQIFACSTAYNAYYAWSTNGTYGTLDVQNVATHELGHWLYLGDLYSTADWDATMYYYIPRSGPAETKKRTLLMDDINGIIAIYGR